MSEIGDYIREKRMHENYTQKELAERMIEISDRSGFPCNVDRDGTMISKWEQGHRVPSPINRKFLSKALDFPYTDLEELV